MEGSVIVASFVMLQQSSLWTSLNLKLLAHGLFCKHSRALDLLHEAFYLCACVLCFFFK